MRIIKLSKDIVIKYYKSFLELDKAISDDRWDLQNYIADYHDKWKYSYLAEERNKLIGFIICSRNSEKNIHIHRLIVAEGERNKGIGKSLIERVNYNLELGEFLSVVVRKTNTLGKNFYSGIGFELFSEENDNYILVMEKYHEYRCGGRAMQPVR